MLTLKGSILIACLIPLAMGTTEVNTEALSAVSQGMNEFSSSLFKAIVDENPGNLICSPLSAAVVLAMAAYGARGNTETQFKSVLHLPTSDELGTSGYQALISNLNNIKNNTLLLANKAFVNQKFHLKPTYKALTEDSFRSTTELVNFGQSAEAANKINSWVKENTKDRIDGIVSSSDLTDDTALVLVNAIYFKGKWKNKFDPMLTKEMPFHVNGKTVKQVPTMYKQNNYKYGVLSQMNAKFIEIPYQGDGMSMVIVLPDEINGLAEVERKMKDVNLNDILRQGYDRDVQLFFPKFKIESKIDLNSPLQQLGLTDAFTSSANFSGIADSPIAISKVIQKAFIEVNEEGSEAAAATGHHVHWHAPAPPTIPETFRVDRPFYLAIKHTDAPLIFTGAILDPNNSANSI
ncbi:leukocyte elastase inhibitor isoform X3 [Nomia melanderi]|uniref:leukocyte elastase inhibitor isoform X3 n=1 Tax=Nomia melanderi TaxID=2448451 RepID=UPI0013043FC5|nr:leukocyte elastase inhibitor-like isoform X3 [Nomia melanderi]